MSSTISFVKITKLFTFDSNLIFVDFAARNSTSISRDHPVSNIVEQKRLLLSGGRHLVQIWRSGESTRLPPMWPGFDSQIRRHMWVEFVGSLLCTERFSPGTPVSPLLKKSTFDLSCVHCYFQFTVSPIRASALERLDT